MEIKTFLTAGIIFLQYLCIRAENECSLNITVLSKSSIRIDFDRFENAISYLITISPRHGWTNSLLFNTTDTCIQVPCLQPDTLYDVTVQASNINWLTRNRTAHTYPAPIKVIVGEKPLPYSTFVFVGTNPRVTQWEFELQNASCAWIWVTKSDNNFGFLVEDLTPNTEYQIRARPSQINNYPANGAEFGEWTNFRTGMLSIFGRVTLVNVTYAGTNASTNIPMLESMIKSASMSLGNFSDLSIIKVENHTATGFTTVHYEIEVFEKSLPVKTNYTLTTIEFVEPAINNGDTSTCPKCSINEICIHKNGGETKCDCDIGFVKSNETCKTPAGGICEAGSCCECVNSAAVDQSGICNRTENFVSAQSNTTTIDPTSATESSTHIDTTTAADPSTSTESSISIDTTATTDPTTSTESSTRIGTTTTTDPTTSTGSSTSIDTTATTDPPQSTGSSTSIGTTTTTDPPTSTESGTSIDTTTTTDPPTSTWLSTSIDTTATTDPPTSIESSTSIGTTTTTDPPTSTESSTSTGTTTTTDPPISTESSTSIYTTPTTDPRTSTESSTSIGTTIFVYPPITTTTRRDTAETAATLQSTVSSTCLDDEYFYYNGSDCVDVNECEDNTHNCTGTSTCTNTQWGFNCDCDNDQSFYYNGSDCVDIDECEQSAGSNCIGNSKCINTIGGFICSCASGYYNNSGVCDDINECIILNDACLGSSVCSNEVGSYTCVCDSGFSYNDSECVDDNECELGTYSCKTGEKCENTEGSYKCNWGYSSYQFTAFIATLAIITQTFIVRGICF